MKVEWMPLIAVHPNGNQLFIGWNDWRGDLDNNSMIDGRLEFGGFPAWIAWLFVHLIFLVGFRNKVAVLLQWAYSYFTYKRGARIVTGLSDEARLDSI